MTSADAGVVVASPPGSLSPWAEPDLFVNILYLHAHDAGRCLAPYGYPVRTPNLQALAEGATLFRNAHCAAPTCSPSRAALLTGQTAHQSGMLGLAHRGFALRDPSRHLAAFLQRQGYVTALSGIQHVLRGTDPLPYDHRFKGPKAEGDWTAHDRSLAAQAAAFLRGTAPSQGRPFFLDCGFWYPHRPFPAPASDIDPDYIHVPPSLPGHADVREDLAGFQTAVEIMDECAGTVLDALDDSGHGNDTLVIFTVDHGIAFPGMKCHLTSRGTGVALMIRYPDNPSAGSAIDALVSHLDLYPTVCDLCGLTPPDWLQGVSLRPVLEQRQAQVHDAIFSEVTFHAAYQPMRSILTERHRLIRRFDEDLSPVPANVDDSPAKRRLRDAGWLNRKERGVEMFDLELDPGETTNIAPEPACAAAFTDLNARLDRWMADTEDPLLGGPVPAPEGAFVNPRHHFSPGQTDAGA